ncbi:MAG TPA: hypothetical protein DCY13_18570 [Verrucomicrobiales bacterium]|nr:hypothetical protein [Verrucomicrobiales bacterium]
MKKYVALLTVGMALQCAAMDASEIKAIVAKPHDDRNIVPELRVLTLGREFEIVASSGQPGGPLTKHAPVISKDKVVEGRYVVSEFQPENTPAPVYEVVEYDGGEGVYRSWLLFPHGKVVEGVGVALSEARVVSWTRLETPYGDNTQSVSVVKYTDDGGEWNEVIRNGSKIVFLNNGRARKVK